MHREVVRGALHRQVFYPTTSPLLISLATTKQKMRVHLATTPAILPAAAGAHPYLSRSNSSDYGGFWNVTFSGLCCTAYPGGGGPHRDPFYGRRIDGG